MKLGNLSLFSAAVLASACVAAPDDVRFTFRNDPGGSVEERDEIIEDMNREGIGGRLVGKHCTSACTMMLGLDDVCIGRETVFHFHGPRSATKGLTLLPDDFEKSSQLMASRYPEGLREWFLEEGRWLIDGTHAKSAKEIASYGFEYC